MRFSTILFFCLLLGVTSCEDFVQIDPPDSIIDTDAVFSSDATAMAAANAMYYGQLQPSGLFGGILMNTTYATGMSGDEVLNYYVDESYEQFYDNTLEPANDFVNQLWSGAYNTLYEANAVIEGVRGNERLTEAVRNQLEGEAKLMRALLHFYLVNMFGDIPIVTHTDYRENASITRMPTSAVYEQIIHDLNDARGLLSPEYMEGEKTRPNLHAATALLARVYLYMGDYSSAEAAATEVITSGVYSLDPASAVFLTNSSEAIWQMSQLKPGSFPTGDAYIFTITHDFFGRSLSPDLVAAFDPADARRAAWVETWTRDGTPYYYAAKYREWYAADPYNFQEYLVMLRLGEQYLIRAEARANQDKLTDAVADLDVIRARAGVALMSDTDPGISREALLLALEHERRLEFFCEMSHRWFDLKRTGRIDAVMQPIKPQWNTTDALYPIPERELNSNPMLGEQNAGY